MAERDEEARTMVRAAVLAAGASAQMHDPTDAEKMLDLDQFDVDHEGRPDWTDITGAVEELLEARPYLSTQRQARFEGGADGGARPADPRMGQIGQEALERMSPAEVVAAKDRGQLDRLLGRDGW